MPTALQSLPASISRRLLPKSTLLFAFLPFTASALPGKGGLNFVELMLKLSRERDRLRVVDDEFVTPTPTFKIAEQLVALSTSDAYGLYHATAEGSCSWYAFAQEIFRACSATCEPEKADPGEFPAKVQRPKYSVLENRALKDAGLNVFTDWREGLQAYLAARAATAEAVL